MGVRWWPPPLGGAYGRKEERIPLRSGILPLRGFSLAWKSWQVNPRLARMHTGVLRHGSEQACITSGEISGRFTESPACVEID